MATRPTIKKGMSGKAGTDVGEAILLWRKFLGKPSILPAPGVTTYDFGAATEGYTKEWQKLSGLVADGVVGPASWAMYEGKMAGAPLPVQVKSAAAEAQGELAKANAMIQAVLKKPVPQVLPTPTAKPIPATTPVAKAKAAAVQAKAAVQEKATQAQAAVQQTVERIKVKSDDMPAWARVLTVGVLGLGALVGFKAVTSDGKRRAA